MDLLRPPDNFVKVINKRRYNTSTATLLASLAGTGRTVHLYRTPRRNYFALHLTLWQGESARVEPLSPEEAQRLYETADASYYGRVYLGYEEALGITPEDA